MPDHQLQTLRSASTRWHSYRRVPSTVLPRKWRHWLLDQGSLTQRLIEASNGHFHVEVAFQGWSTPSLSEARTLNIHPRQQVLIREVRLCGHGRAWVYARSVIPASTLTGQQRILKHLGNRPLGALLFKDPTMQRGAIEISRLAPTEARDRAWARRSVFSLRGKPLLVTEVFLPALLGASGAAAIAVDTASPTDSGRGAAH